MKTDSVMVPTVMDAPLLWEIAAPRPAHSVCITTFNDADTIRASLDSLFGQIDRAETEVVVVDAKSRDGSTEILREYEKQGLLKLYVERCSVGRGRQLAFLHSSGKYLITGVDTDDTLRPVLPQMLRLYHQEHEGEMLEGRDFWVLPREIAEKVGWRDTQAAEDHMFIQDAKRMGFKVAHRHDLRLREVIRTRHYEGPFRLLENMRRFSNNRKVGLLTLKTKPSTRAFWRALWILSCTKVIDNRATMKALDWLVMNFGVTT